MSKKEGIEVCVLLVTAYDMATATLMDKNAERLKTKQMAMEWKM